MIRMDSIVPLTLPRIRFQVNVFELLVRDAAVRLVECVIKSAINLESLVSRCSSDQVNNNLMGDKRFASPVLGNKRKESMLNLVPLTRTRR